MSASVITLFTKSGGPLSKQIWLEKDGGVKSDGAACVMTRGRAERVKIASAEGLAELTGELRSDQAIGLGVLRNDLPVRVTIHMKDYINGTQRPDIIARTASNIVFEPGRRA